MKRSSDSLGTFMSICRSTEETIYSRELQTMMESLEEEETEHVGFSEKKRRLGVGQVKALEKNFEVENKLEPERKVKLAEELGLQPRQVAVWFQNRRARWKTKQLERDYGVLKASYDSLKLNYDALHRHNETLLKEIRELKSKLNYEGTNNSDNCSNTITGGNLGAAIDDDIIKPGAAVLVELIPSHLITDLIINIKEPNLPSDSDSSAILNEEINAITSPNCNSSNGAAAASAAAAAAAAAISSHHNNLFQPQQFVKIEEHNFFSGDDEACDFFSDEQAPTLQWCYPDVMINGPDHDMMI